MSSILLSYPSRIVMATITNGDGVWSGMVYVVAFAGCPVPLRLRTLINLGGQRIAVSAGVPHV